MNSVTLQTARARTIVCVLGAILGMLFFSLALFAQGDFGRILGTVTDPSGAVISGATVSIIDTQRGLARTLTTDLKARKIRVNLVSPGPIQTPGLDVFANDDVKNALKSTVPLDRLGTADEVASAVLFLLSPAAGYINGVLLPVDGGWIHA